MAEISTISSSDARNALQSAFLLSEIVPGDDPSYEACKAVMLYHPLGYKITETPIRLAQSMPRVITIPNGPEERLREEFERVWVRLDATRLIRNLARLSRCYGIASLVVGAEGVDTQKPMDWVNLHKQDLYFNILDPLNTSGSLVLNQDPNAPDFLKKRAGVQANGVLYHSSRSCILMNEDPVFISYTSSSFGFVGRSVFQRAWYPLKSFIQTMITDDMISRKAGVLVAKMKAPGSIISRSMVDMAAYKRQMLQNAETDNVLGISPEEAIESLNMQNLDGAGKFARDNILKNIAAACDEPAVLLDQETFAAGMAEGSEDMKAVAQYIDTIREDLNPTYLFLDNIVQHVAWNPEFYLAIQSEFPEYRKVTYERAFQDWQRNFQATWPSFLREEPSKQVETENTKQKAIMAFLQIALPVVGPKNRANLLRWAQDNLNANKNLFSTELQLDEEEIIEYSQCDSVAPHEAPTLPNKPRPMSELS